MKARSTSKTQQECICEEDWRHN